MNGSSAVASIFGGLRPDRWRRQASERAAHEHRYIPTRARVAKSDGYTRGGHNLSVSPIALFSDE